MEFGFYPEWDSGFVNDFLDELKADGQRKKAEARITGDLLILQNHWPDTLNVTVRSLKGHEPLWELKRDYQNIAYRVFFCVKGQEMWLLHAIEKKKDKTPLSGLALAQARMRDVLTGKVRR